MNNVVTLLEPEYYSKFKCTGSECKNTCCTGWDIILDKNTYKKYRKVKNKEFAGRLLKAISRIRKDSSDFKYARIKDANSGCSLIDEDGLCSVYKHLGHDYLSLTCQKFPRHFNKIGNTYNRVLSIACEESARIVLKDKNKMTFRIIEDEIGHGGLFSKVVNIKSDSDWRVHHGQLLEAFIDILQCRDYRINERLIIVGMLAEQIDEAISNKEIQNIPNILSEFVDCANGGLFKGLTVDMKVREDIQHKTYTEILNFNIIHKKVPNEFLEYMSFSAGKLMLDTEFNSDTKKKIQEYNRKYNEFIKEHEYILENYLVNTVLLKSLTVSYDNILTGIFNLVLRHSYLKMCMAGLSDDNYSVESVVDILRLLERHMGHSSIFEYQLKALTDSESLKLENAILIINN